MPELIRQLTNLAVTFWTQASKFVSKHRGWVNIGVYTIFVALLFYTLYQFGYTKEFTLYTGSVGTSSNDYAKKLEEKFNVPFSRRILKTVETQGFADNLERVARDNKGNEIGFSHIGFGDMSKTRVLLPLENNFLYIVCANDFFEHLVKKCEDCKRLESDDTAEETEVDEDQKPAKPNPVVAAAQPASGEKVADDGNKDKRKKLNLKMLLYAHQNLIENGDPSKRHANTDLASSNDSNRKRTLRDLHFDKLRVSIGERKSGAHELATRVLEHFDVKIDEESGEPMNSKYFTFDQSSGYRDAFAKLKHGELDLIFCLGPANFDLVKSCRNHAFLVDLGTSAEVLISKLGKPVDQANLVDGFFGERIPSANIRDTCKLKVPDPNSIGKPVCFEKPRFCENVEVLQTRRVLICSRAMSKNDAYNIATLAKHQLIDEVNSAGWASFDNRANRNRPYSYAVSLHEGAELVRDGKSLSNWDSITKAFGDAWMLILFTSLAYVLSQLNSWLSPGPATPPTPPTEETNIGNDPSPNDGGAAVAAIVDVDSTTQIPEELVIVGETATPENEVNYKRLNDHIERMHVELMLSKPTLGRKRILEKKAEHERLQLVIENAVLTTHQKSVLKESLSEFQGKFNDQYEISPTS